MRRKLFTPFVCLLVVLCLVPALFAATKAQDHKVGNSRVKGSKLIPTVERSIKNDTTIPFRNMKPLPIKQGEAETEAHEVINRVLPKALRSIDKAGKTSLLMKSQPAPKAMVSTFENFEGTDNLCGCLPPDTNGDVGPNHYVQTVNNQIQIFDKQGNSLLGPEPINTLWDGFGGACEAQNNGDPIALYDQLADRWLISQFALFASGGHNHQCVAISQTGDPTGAYFRYDFDLGTTVNDYPHLGVWPDGYYMTVNQFTPSFAWAGAGVYAFERDKMLLGQSAQKVYFNLFSVNSDFGGMLPSDLDGPAPDPGTPNVFAEVDDDAFGVATDRVSLWDFHVDWTTPGNSTFGLSGQPNTHIDTDAFDANMCNFNRSCIDQPGTGQGLDAISDRLMHRLQYRNFGGYATLVGNHTVDADGTDHAGVDWFSLRNDGSGWAMNDQGIYAPDADSRWMGSAAMDSAGNIVLGFSVSGAGTFPSIRYAGRLISDPAGQMSQGEGTIIAGTGNQTHPAARWGDYSGISVDPSPGNFGGIDCDFWYTTEYIETSGSANWQTRIGAFSFAPGACGGPHGDLDGTITDSSTTNPIQGAKVQVQPGGFSTVTDVNGHYHMTLSAVPGLYDVTASSYGYFSETQNGVQVTDGGSTIQDFALDPAPHVTVSGTVTDGSGHGWPLYSRIDIAGYPFGAIFTDPFNGTYSVELIQDAPYTFTVHAISGGYSNGVRPVTPPPGGSTENFALTVDQSTCDAPGYALTSGVFEKFDSGSTPSGWTVVDNESNGEEWAFVDPEAQPNNTGGTGLFAVINSDFYGPDGQQDTELRSPVLDFSAKSNVHLEFDTDFKYYGDPPETADVDVSTDGGTNWTNVLTYQNQDTAGPHHEDLDISSIAGNKSNVRVRFHYYNAVYEWWWQVDNVKIGATCGLIPGGLLAGNVYDGNTGLGLNGAKVASDNAPADKTTAFSTLFDPNVDEGFYILFSSLTGGNPFTGSKNSYGSDTEPVTVTADQLVKQDFHLAAGNLNGTPNPFEDTVDLGTQDTITLHMNNTGGASADFELQEGNGNTNAPQANGKGAPLIHVKGHYSPLKIGATTRPTKLVFKDGDKDDAITATPAPNAPPWTDITAYPSSIMDNTCAEIDGKIYCVGGFDGADTTNSGSVYDPGDNSWASIASMNDAREKPVVAAIDGKLYVTGGWDSGGTPDPTLEIYDPIADSWSTGASIPTAYAAATGVNLDGKFYVIGGCDQTCGFTDVQVYDPAGDSWSSVADYPEPISWQACGASGGLIYCAGGVADSESKSTYSYDPGSDAWTQLADMPQTQWAGGFTISDDQLYVSGGVTANFTAVTNEGFVYDPGADSWTAIENSNNTLYRGGSACGLYRIGGSSGGFNPVPDSEVYPGLTNCGGVIDVPWLSESPTTGTVAANDTNDIDVTFDASQVTQPGDYLAHFRIKENTPYTTPDVQVTMHVPLPADWGYLTGTVTGLARCDLPGSPLKKATVLVDTSGTDYTLKTDADGKYLIAFPIADGPATVTASMGGYVTKFVSGVNVDHDNITTEDFDLRLDGACIDVESVPPADPPLVSATVALGAIDNSLQFTMLNTGAADADFELLEGNGLTNAPQAKPAPVKRLHGQFSPHSLVATTGQKFGVTQTPASSPNAPPWTAIANYPTGIMDNTCADIDGLIYCVGGVDSGLNTTASGNVYDPNTNTWSAIADMSDAREKPAVAAIDGKLYVTGGWDASGSPDGTLEIYDPSGNSWTAGATNPKPFAASTGVNLDGQFYVIGGCNSGTCGFKNVQVYDPSGNSWSSATDYPEVTSWNACGAISGQIYCAGGVSDADGESQHTYGFDGSTWTPLADLPQTQWGMGYIGSDEKLYISGGVTDNFSTVTNEGFAYDTNANTWASIENSNNSVYRGGSACGFYKIGGSSGGFNPGNASEVYPGLTSCGAALDVLWLSENPTTGTLLADSTPGNETTIAVTFDATQVDQPGDYLAHVKIKTSYSVPNVNAQMHVPLPAGWGYVDGTVKGDLRCDLPGNPLKTATVLVHPHNGPKDYTLKTDASGYFKVAFVAGLVDLTVSKNGYILQSRTNINIDPGEVGTNPAQNFDLRLDAPCLDIQPQLLETTVNLFDPPTTDTLPFTITNTGAGAAEFQLKEGNGNSAAPQVIKNPKKRGTGAPVMRIKGQFSSMSLSGAKKSAPQMLNSTSKPIAPNAPPWTAIASYPTPVMDNTCADIEGLMYCVGGIDDGFNVLSAGYVYDPGSDAWTAIADMSDAREKPAVAAIDGKLYVTGGWDASGSPDSTLEIYDPGSNSWSTGASIPTPYAAATGVNLDGQFYVIGGCDSGTCGVTDVQVYDPAGDSWSTAENYPEDTSWSACGAISGQIYCAGGVSDSNGESQHTYAFDGSTWTPLADMPQTQWAMGYVASDDLLYISGGVTDNFSTVTNEGFAYDPSGDSWTAIENSNNTVYRGGSACGFYKVGGSSGGFSPDDSAEVDPGLTNCGASSDILWLTEDPDSGTVAADIGEQSIDVTFDGTQVNQPGDYKAHIKVKTSYGVPDVQAIMHVPLPDTWGYLEGVVTGLARCDQPGSPLNKATVFVDTGNTTYELKTDSNGHYLVAFPIADGPNTSITASANHYVTQTNTGVTLDHNVNAVLNFDLRLDAPCADKTPTSFSEDLGSGATMTLPLTLNNTGAGTLTYEIRETLFPLIPQLPNLRKATAPKNAPATKTPGPSSVLSLKPKKGASRMPVPSDAWFMALPVPDGLVRYAHAQCDTQPNSFYVFSGVDGSFSYTRNAWRFDATTNTWNALASIPVGSEGSTATCYQGRIYVMGGSSDGFGGGTQFYVYDIATNTWLSAADLPRPVLGAASGAWSGKVFLIGGDLDFFGGGTSAEVDIYDIATDTWTGTGADMPVASFASGYVQAGNYLYLVGGWDDSSAPDSNLVATQRYDMSEDSWETGPDLPSGRADFALGMTDVALYAMGGDDDGNGFFDPTDGVTRFELGDWPDGEWTDVTPGIPVPYTSNSAGFCTQAIAAGSEIWSLGGFSQDFTIDGTNTFRPSKTEHCYSIFTDVPWLSEEPVSGSVDPDSNGDVDITFDATGLAAGDYNAVLVVSTNDFGATQFNIPVTLHIGTFHDDFDDGDYTTPEWTIVGHSGSFDASSGDLVGTTPKKIEAVSPAFGTGGCSTCTIVANMNAETAGETLSLFGWRADKKNYVEIRLKMGSGKVQVFQKVAGTTVLKHSEPFTLPTGDYTVQASFDGTNFNIQVTQGANVLNFSLPAVGTPQGTLSFRVKGGTGTLKDVTVF